MPEMTDDQLAAKVRAALAAEASSIEVADGAEPVARARARSTPDHSLRAWALAGIAATLVLVLSAVGFVALRSRAEPGTIAPATQSASPSAEHSSPPPPTPAVSSIAGRFVPTGSMSGGPLVGGTATLLADGRVLVAGVWPASPLVSTAELYDPKAGAFSPTGSMITARQEYTATMLLDGRVLIVGGSDPTGHGPLSSAELYDPATGKFSLTGSLAHGRYGQTATLLADGRVLIAGGDEGSFKVVPAELYDPKTGMFSPTGSPMDFRQHGQTATLLADGRVLIAGGWGISQFGISAATSTAEVYDPATGKFTATGSMSIFRTGHTATLLHDGRVLIAGGPNSAELYDPQAGTFSPIGAMIAPRTDATATLLADGRVLIAGGDASATIVVPQASAEVYDPSTGTFGATGSMAMARESATATFLSDGRVLIAGGSVDASAELYLP